MNNMSEIRRFNFQKIADKYASQRVLADIVGLTPAYVNHLLTGHRNIGEKTARKIEAKLKLPNLALDNINETANIGKKYSKQLHESNAEYAPGILGFVPLISWVQAGAWQEAIQLYSAEDAEEKLPCPITHSSNTYALKVKGDSMTAPYPSQHSYAEGTIIFVDPDRALTNGCRVIAKLPHSNEVTFKEYREDAGKRYLKPLNPQYQIKEINDDTILCGVVIGQFKAE